MPVNMHTCRVLAFYKAAIINAVFVSIVVYMLGLSSFCFAQIKTIDSLKSTLLNARDTQQVNILNEIAELYFQLPGYVNTNYISAEQYANRAFQLSKHINYKKGIGNALLNSALVIAQEEKNLYAIELFTNAIPFLKELNENKQLGTCYEQLAECLHLVGKNEHAIQYYDSSFAIFQKIKDTSGIILSLAGKGHSYFDLGDYKNAYAVGESAYELAQKTKDTIAQIYTADHLANLFLGAGMPETVLEYMRIITLFYPNIYSQKKFSSWQTWWGLLKAGEAYLQLGDIDSAMQVAQTVGFDSDNIDKDMFLGHLYKAKHEYIKALPYYTSGLKISEQSDHIISVARHANGLSQINLALGNYDAALRYANKAAHAAQSIHALLEMKNAIGTLTDIYDKTHNYSKAYHFSQLYKSLSDSLAPEEYKRKLALIQIQRELENQKQQAQLLAKENQLQLQQNTFEKDRSKKIQTIAIIIITASVLIIAAIMINIRLKRKKDQLQKKQLQQELELQVAESKRHDADFKVRSFELEMQALRAQMNPHFIFNSLNCINMFILENNKLQASEYLSKFSRLVRLILQNSQEAFIPLEKELEALRLYLQLESLRFKNKFEHTISVDENVDTAMLKVPPLVIQPFAENAIWHGLMHKKEKGRLEIEVYMHEEILFCKIADDGIGRKKAAELKSRSALTHKSMGMSITANRIAALQQQNEKENFISITDLVLSDGSPGGTEVLIKIPARYD